MHSSSSSSNAFFYQEGRKNKLRLLSEDVGVGKFVNRGTFFLLTSLGDSALLIALEMHNFDGFLFF